MLSKTVNRKKKRNDDDLDLDELAFMKLKIYIETTTAD